MVIESAFLDWRQPARRARADDLIARSTLEIGSVHGAPASFDDPERAGKVHVP
jgi:hypothetical protein